MRLRRLDLVRYGKFSDRTIDFGPKPHSGPDFHVVFGLNEAGKSTALSGYLDLLYGIEERSRYNFLHEYSAMRVGGVLELGGEEHTFSRTKQRNNSLLNALGQPISDLAITAHLAGLSREAYQTMFSLDDETLEAGGKAILESRGDLGKLLFTASAGLAHVNDTLLALEAEADGLYRKQAHGTELARLKKRLTELKSDKDKIDTLASEFEKLEAEHCDATEKYEQSMAERSVLSARLDTIAKYLRAIPILAEIRRKTAQLAELPDIPSPPRTWTGNVAELIDNDASLRTKRSAVLDEIQRATDKIQLAEVDEAILAISEQVRGLSDRRVRYVSAGLDLPNRRTELQLLDSSAASCLASLGRASEPNPAALVLPAATVGAIRSLLELRSGIITSVRVARDEAAAALEALQTARDRVGEERAVPEPVRARLMSALSRARGSGHQQEMKTAREAVAGAEVRLAVAMRRLPPLSGDVEKLRVISAPSHPQVAAWRRRAADLSQRQALLSDRLTEYQETQGSLLRRLDVLRSTANVTEDEIATAIRLARDEAWVRHRNNLISETADDFAAALARDDSASADRLTNAQHLAEIRTTHRSLSEIETLIARSREQILQIDGDVGAAVSEIYSSARDLLGECPALSLEPLIELIEDRSSALRDGLDAWAEIEAARKSADRASDEGKQVHLELIKALESVGIQPDSGNVLETTIAAAELFLDRQANVDAERAEALRTVGTKEDDLVARRRALGIAERREQEWHADVADALKGTWLEGAMSTSSLANVLVQLAELSRTLHDRDALDLRIGKMEADRANFVAEIAATAAEAGQLVDDAEPEQLAIRLAARLEQAERASEAKGKLVGELQQLHNARDAVEAQISTHERQKNDVLRLFGVATLAEVMERDDLLKQRDGLRAAIAELEDRLSAELLADSVVQAHSILDGVQIDGLTRDKAEIEQRLQALDEIMRGQLVRQTRAADKLDAIGGDSAVARIDVERRTVLLAIEDKAVRYLELKLGVMSAGMALRAYRESHRSAMMARASDAFALITRCQYSGLTTQSVKGSDVLIALQSDGQSKLADALSKGARFQLYLALRLAGYYEFAQLRPSVPFVADDIMETFDHIRSEEVFRLFGEMAIAGQVIYLTHHQHLCEIAKAVVPSVAIHQLA